MWAHYRFVFLAVARHAAFDGADECHMPSLLLIRVHFCFSNGVSAPIGRDFAQMYAKLAGRCQELCETYSKRAESSSRGTRFEQISPDRRRNLVRGVKITRFAKFLPGLAASFLRSGKVWGIGVPEGAPIVPSRGTRPFDGRFWQRCRRPGRACGLRLRFCAHLFTVLEFRPSSAQHSVIGPPVEMT